MSLNFGVDYSTENSGGTAFNAGINDNVKLVSLSHVNIDTPNFTGQAVDINFEKDGSTLRARIFEPTERNVYPYDSIKVNGQERPETQEEAFARTARKVNLYLNQFVSAFHPADFNAASEDVRSKFVAYVQQNQGNINFKQMVDFYSNLLKALNPNHSNVPGQLICTYKGKYLEVPNNPYLNGGNPLFSIKNDLTISDKLQKKTVREEEKATVTTSDDYSDF